jgi:hypothetical protein
MVGTDDDPSISNDPEDWPLLCDAVSFVAETARTEAAALERICDLLHFDQLPWRWGKMERNCTAYSPPDKLLESIMRLFWRRSARTRHEVDHSNSCAVRTGAGIVDVYFDGKGRLQPIFDHRCLLTMRATLIRVYRPVLVHDSQGIGSLPWFSPSSIPAETKKAPAPTVAKNPIAAKRTEPDWDPQTDWSAAMQYLGLTGQRQKQAMEKLVGACQRLPELPRYRRKSPPKILDDITAAELKRAMDDLGINVSDDTCERFLSTWRTKRSPQ